MAKHIQAFDPRQDMTRGEYEIQHKRDTYLKNVELHHHDFYEIFFLVSGDVTYAIESKLYHVMPGDMLLISPRELHQVYVRPDMESYERYVLWLDSKLLRRLSTEDTDLGRCLDPLSPGYSNSLRLSPEARSTVGYLMERIYQEAESGHFGSDLLQDSLIRHLLIELNRQAAHNGQSDAVSDGSPVVDEVVRYVNQHYGEALPLTVLAEQFHISKYHLCHEFQRQMGSSIHRYIRKKRLQIARQLLAEGQKPNTVYGSCGFGDYTCFYRAFMGEYGISPRNFSALAKEHQPERMEVNENH